MSKTHDPKIIVALDYADAASALKLVNWLDPDVYKRQDDTSRMLEALQTLGVKLENFGENAWRITGCGGNFPNKKAEIFLGNAGTAFRPLTAALAITGGEYTLSGVPRMHERPIGDLVDALKQAGAEIQYLADDGFPPLKIALPSIDLSKPVSYTHLDVYKRQL